jgi:uncharacterized membrane protein
MPMLIAKLVLVAILIVILFMMDRRWRGAVKNGGGPDLIALPKLGKIALPIGLLIIILAVLAFN